jgi:hypothetical protein
VSLTALVVLAVLPYLGSLENPLLHDDRTLLDNRWLREEADPISVFSHDFWHGTRHAGSDLYRPVTVLSLAWNLRIAPGRAGFHLVNIALHAVTALLVAAALRAVWGASGRLSPRAADAAAWLGAALWAVHPLASEAVLMAVGRAEILAALLGLGAFVLLVRSETGGHGSGGTLALSCVLLFLALGSKESAAAWIVVFAAWWLLRGGIVGARRSLAIRACCYGATLLLFLMLRTSAVGWGVHEAPWIDNPLVRLGPLERAANGILLLARYGLGAVFPRRLSVEHGFDQIRPVSLLPWGALLAAVAIGLFLVVLFALRRADRGAAFLWTFAPAAFAVTANVVFPIGTIFAERLAYLPLAGLCGLAGWAIGWARIGSGSRAGIAIVLLAVLSARTAIRSRDFRALVRFQEATCSASPRSVKAMVNLARTRLELQKKPAEAIVLLERAVAMFPDYSRALHLLGQAYAAEGRSDLATEFERRAAEASGRLEGND